MTSPSVKLLRTQTDDRLVALAAAGHERAFEAIVERYRRQLLRHSRRYLAEARADDALQQALVSAWSALRRGDEVRELRPWLHRIVHNASLNALRTAGYDYEQLHDTLHGGGGPAELAERSAVVRQTLAGLAALPERQREALLQIAVEGRSQDEVAEELGLSHGAVRQLVHRARTSLRAAATAVVPLPVAGWLASEDDGRGDLVARIGELVAGAGGGATLAKAGTVAAIAGTAVGGPVVMDQIAERPDKADRSTAIAAPARPDGGGVGGRDPGAAVTAPGGEAGIGLPGPDGDDGDRSGHGGADDRSGRRGDDRSGRGGSGRGSGSDHGGSSGSGSDRGGSSGTNSGHGGSSGDGSGEGGSSGGGSAQGSSGSGSSSGGGSGKGSGSSAGSGSGDRGGSSDLDGAGGRSDSSGDDDRSGASDDDPEDGSSGSGSPGAVSAPGDDSSGTGSGSEDGPDDSSGSGGGSDD